MNIKISNANNIKLYIRRVCIQNSYKYKKKILDKYVFVISTSIILAWKIKCQTESAYTDRYGILGADADTNIRE